MINILIGLTINIFGLVVLWGGWHSNSNWFRVWWLPRDMPDRIFIDRLLSAVVGIGFIVVGSLIIFY